MPAPAPPVLWRFASTTERDLQAVRQVEIGSYALVLTGAGTYYQAVAAGVGAALWAQVASASDDPSDLDARLDVLETIRPRVASKAILYTDLTDADGSQTFAFASALPAGAILLGCGIDVTVAFTDGVAGVFTADMGINAGDIDAFIDGSAVGAIAKVSGPAGIRPVGLVGAITPCIVMLATVNLNTATAGALTAYVYYINGATLD